MYPTSKSQVYHHIAYNICQKVRHPPILGQTHMFKKGCYSCKRWKLELLRPAKMLCIMIVPLQVYVFEETVLSDINMFPSLCLSFNIYVHT